MAVSFKVPASPKRSIFAIDEFQGVDLTNTGTNIDEIRSPNAENMVRFVPGKVRKRTGYQTKIEFSDRKDVNRASNTSDDYFTLTHVGDSYDTRQSFNSFYEDIVNPNIYLEVECIGTYVIGVDYSEGDGAQIADLVGTEEEHEFTVSLFQPTTDRSVTALYAYRTSTGADDYIKVRRVRACIDTTAETEDEWKEKEWSAAPEDNGIIFKKRDTTSPVYGCHFLKTGSIEGNRVLNVNRVLNTSDEFVDHTILGENHETIGTMGEEIYRNVETHELSDVYVEFDYKIDGDGDFTVRVGQVENTDYVLTDTGGDTFHYSAKFKTASYPEHFYNSTVEIFRRNITTNRAVVSIKNLSVMYDKSESYVWKPAPEDNGGVFHVEDLYNVDGDNKAIINSYSNTIEQTGSTPITSLEDSVTIANADSKIDGWVKVSFDLYANISCPSSAPSENFQILIYNSDNSQYIYADKNVWDYDGNIDTRHFEYYVSPAPFGTYSYINTIRIIGRIPAEPNTQTLKWTLNNIKLEKITRRSNFDKANRNYIYHVGKEFFLRPYNSDKVTLIYSDANTHHSQSWQLDEKLIILDGKDIYTYESGSDSVSILGSDNAYIPWVTASKDPSGGGVSVESLNLLQPGFYETFIVESGHATEKVFHLSFNNLDDTKTMAWILDGNGNWIEKSEGTHYSVNRGSGIVTFVTAPGATPIMGEDNVKILAYKTVEGYADRIKKCTIGTLYGVGGASDRLFLSGNPDHPNWDFYSEEYDPTYFPDTGYSVLGLAQSAIVGYAIVNNYLATFKDEYDNSQSVFIREGDMVVDDSTGTSEPAFKLINTLQGNGVIAPYAFGYLQNEPLFLTRSGIYAITAQDITGEKYAQNRSFYLNGQLTKESELESSVATVFNDQYILAINNKLYILDGLQSVRTDRSEPYSTRQYAAFYCTNIPAVSIWTDEQALWIGTTRGKVCRFATDIEALESYNDDGEPIYCCWETPDLDGKLFYKNKTFRYFAIRMMQALRTSVKLYSRKLGSWSFIKEDTASGVVFDFENIDFELFSFSTDTSEKVVHTKVRVKKVDKARFKVENGNLNEPFGLFDLALEYVESGNYKG